MTGISRFTRGPWQDGHGQSPTWWNPGSFQQQRAPANWKWCGSSERRWAHGTCSSRR
ncbi:hypothetical protein BJV78DRAFT_1231306 [Lactifluus subvellereus]|nr:hypothetical protein BJV78DRAFT_1231306 [Lactifluus subvellereus]